MRNIRKARLSYVPGYVELQVDMPEKNREVAHSLF